MTAELSRAARLRLAAPAAEPAAAEVIEVTFTPAEPQLTPGAARAVLALLLRAREIAQARDRPEEQADLKSAAESWYHRGPGTLRAGLLPAGASRHGPR